MIIMDWADILKEKKPPLFLPSGKRNPAAEVKRKFPKKDETVESEPEVLSPDDRIREMAMAAGGPQPDYLTESAAQPEVEATPEAAPPTPEQMKFREAMKKKNATEIKFKEFNDKFNSDPASIGDNPTEFLAAAGEYGKALIEFSKINTSRVQNPGISVKDMWPGYNKPTAENIYYS
jgi:hypothetical protein